MSHHSHSGLEESAAIIAEVGGARLSKFAGSERASERPVRPSFREARPASTQTAKAADVRREKARKEGVRASEWENRRGRSE